MIYLKDMLCHTQDLTVTLAAEIIDRCKNLLKSSPEWLKDEKKIAVETFIKQLEDKDSEEELEK